MTQCPTNQTRKQLDDLVLVLFDVPVAAVWVLGHQINKSISLFIPTDHLMIICHELIQANVGTRAADDDLTILLHCYDLAHFVDFLLVKGKGAADCSATPSGGDLGRNPFRTQISLWPRYFAGELPFLPALSSLAF